MSQEAPPVRKNARGSITIVTRSVLVPGSLTINVIWKNSFAGFIKLQIRLLSIDKQNSYAIIAVKENDNKRE